MAEARNAIDLYYLQKRGFAIAGVEDGYFTLTISIPYPKTVFNQTLLSLKKTYNYMQNRLWPASISSVIAVMSIATSATVLSSKTSTLRNSSYANLLWYLDSKYSPLVNFLPPGALAVEMRVGYLAAFTSLLAMLGLMTFERLGLRFLLGSRSWLYLKPKQPIPLKIKIWGFFVKLFSGNVSLTYSFATSLPSLPLPNLSSTTDKYLESVEPLLTVSEFEKAKKEVELFRKKNGKTFQRFLFGKWLFSRNYIADWWEKYVYLRGRTPLCVNSNYYIMDSKFRPTTSQTKRAANVTYHFMKFAQLISEEKLEPLRIRGSIPLCMEQYRNMFGTCRVPGREFDEIKHTEPRHIVVLYKGEYFQIKVFRGARGTSLDLMSKEELEKQLAWIVKTVDMEETQEVSDRRSRKSVTFSSMTKMNKVQSYSDFLSLDNATKEDKIPSKRFSHRGIGIAALTAGPRSNWAEVREIFFSQGVNRASLRSIEKSAMLLVLDDSPITDQSKTLSARASNLFHGDGFNRYFDKSVSLIVFKDGYLGLNCEHSWADAIPAAHLFEYGLLHELIDCYSVADKESSIPDLDTTEFIAPKRLTWEVTPQLEDTIYQAGVFARRLISDVEVEVQEFDLYGPGEMKKSGFSPDSFIQMALQLAYFRDRKTFDLTYESSTTRLFRSGRTETIRSLSNESVAFVKAMESKEKGATPEDEGVWRTNTIEKLRAAAAKHSLRAKDAMAGRGIDRHLFALYITSRGLDRDSNFLASALSMPWRLSTSQQTQHQTNLRKQLNPEMAKKFLSPGGGFGPVADDGYGVSYMTVGNERVFFHVSSKKTSEATSSKRFLTNIISSLEDLKQLLQI
eukprot:maker-scaffold_2-snap-gene-20.37-mRNA-1 protein AED:0.01 eAED:0.01 QI:104/1/1/1/1/1/2/70/846